MQIHCSDQLLTVNCSFFRNAGIPGPMTDRRPAKNLIAGHILPTVPLRLLPSSSRGAAVSAALATMSGNRRMSAANHCCTGFVVLGSLNAVTECEGGSTEVFDNAFACWENGAGGSPRKIPSKRVVGEWQRPSGMLRQAFTKMTATDRNVGLIATDADLLTGTNRTTVRVQSEYSGGTASAVADCLDF